MAAPSASLTCPQCAYVNEAERVYCHNCGAKLDRSVLPRDDEATTKDSIERTRKRVKKMTNPSSTSVARELKTAVSTLIWSAVVAALFLIARKPEAVPEPNKDLGQRIISSEILDAVESPRPFTLQFSESDVNSHLKGVKSKTSGGMPGVEFQRAFIKFDPGVCRIGMQQNLWGWPIYSGAAYRLDVKEGKFIATNVGGNFGRLSLHPVLMQYADAAFRKLWGALKRERQQMDKMQRVVVDKGRITLVTKGAGR